MTDYSSPLLRWPGTVPADGIDAGTAWHYGDPLGEQRRAVAGAGLIDRSHRDVLIVPGPDRLEWLHAITTQHVSQLLDGESTQNLVLSPNGHIEQHWNLTEFNGDSGAVWIDTEPGAGEEVLGYLLKMRFLKRVEPALITADYAMLSLIGPSTMEVLAKAGVPVPGSVAVQLELGGFVRARPDGGADLILTRDQLEPQASQLVAAGATPLGSWGSEALRIERREPRLRLETDHRTIPHEVSWIGTAVHLDKGCYRGQETVARVQNMGKPPRRLVLVHLSGDSERLPATGTAIERDGRAVGFVGTAAYHHELGPIALAVVKRGVGLADHLVAGEHSASVDSADAEAVVVEGFAGRSGPVQTTA
jgi:folate-binding protein YgfZ